MEVINQIEIKKTKEVVMEKGKVAEPEEMAEPVAAENATLGPLEPAPKVLEA